VPPQLQALLQNRNVLIGAGAGLLLIIVLIVVLSLNGGGGEKKKEDPGAKPLLPAQLKLASDISSGKALEIQAILARQGIRLDTEPGTGGKVSLMFDKEATLNDRDRAVLGMVSSGLMDGHLGMEAFDSSDMMASPDEKRIKLVRAQQGELARIIRKMSPIEDVAVKISVADSSVFSTEASKPSVSIQVTLPPDDRLTRDKVRAIINLSVGAIQGLDAKHVALSDTNGNTYNSVLNGTMEMQDKIEEQDQYMKQKIQAQLDKLIGVNHYVVTVSTLLRESPRETMVQSFDTDKSAISTKQRFTEKLGSGGEGGGSGSKLSASGPVSSFLPPELDSKVALDGMAANMMGKETNTSTGDDGYKREGTEVAYNNGKTQWVETSLPGMLEEISIAVTVDDDHFPNIPPADLQALIAHAASPKVMPENVSIAKTDFQAPTPMASTETLAEPTVETGSFMFPGLDANATNGLMAWLPWMAITVLAVVAIMLLMSTAGKSDKTATDLQTTLNEVNDLRTASQQTQDQLRYQEQVNQQLMQQQQQQQVQLQQAQGQNAEKLQATLQQLNQSMQQQGSASTSSVNPSQVDLQAWLESS
jgi:flagellar biosynthesis/type III secretory pathway M-ring protein FliF/YscJ